MIRLTRPSILPRRGMELVTVGDTYAVFVWFSARKEPTELTICEHGSSIWRKSSGPGSVYHRVSMTKLSPGITYRYKLKRDMSFVNGKFATLTPPDKSRLFRFALLSDTHIGFPGRKEKMLREAIEEINEWNVALAIVAGDCAHRGGVGQIRKLYRLLAGLTCPFYVIPGNHEDSNPAAPNLYARLMGMKKSYFSFRQKGHLFICLDSSGRKGQSIPQGGRIEPEQFEWLQTVLAASRRRPVFILVHHFCNIDNCQPFIPINNNWRFHGIGNRVRFQKLLANYPNVVGVFSGHVHLNSVTTSPITGSMPYVALPSTVDYPCGYVLVDVYEKGYIKTFHMVRNTNEQYRRLLIRADEMQNWSTDQNWRADLALGTRQERNFVYMYKSH